MTTAVVPGSPLPSQGDRNVYYILTDDFAYGSKFFPAGSMCFLKERTYLHSIACGTTSTPYMRVTMLEGHSIVTIEAEILQPVNEEEAVFLLAINTLNERLNYFLDRCSLEAAVKATVGQQVMVDLNQELFTGTIRYVGKITKSPLSSSLCPSYFGVELQGDGEGRGHSDGTYIGSEYFKCKENCGLFLPLNKIRFIPALGSDPAREEPKPDVDEVVPVKVGDTIGFYLDDVFRQGIAMDVYKEGTQWLVKVCPEEEGPTDVFRDIPMDSVVKEGLLSPVFEPDMAPGSLRQLKRERSGSGEELESEKQSLDVNSMVQITLDKGNLVSGIIRWLGYLPRIEPKMAGVELDEEKGVTDGEWLGTRYFHCPSKRGLFVKLQSCQPDMRFQCVSSGLLDPSTCSRIDSPEVLANFPPLRNGTAVSVLQGRMRGIQGHCNSCYMDAALFRVQMNGVNVPAMHEYDFSLNIAKKSFSSEGVKRNVNFYQASVLSFSPVFLWKVLSVFMLIVELSNSETNQVFSTPNQASAIPGVREKQFSVRNTSPELTVLFPFWRRWDREVCWLGLICDFPQLSDPEEFLNLIMHHILGIEPLLKLQSGGQKEQECYCYQIFIDKQEELVVPNVQQLVEHSFLSSNLKLVEIPSCFIIQMPRFGKEYKMFSKIIPSLELDITDLLLDSPRECFVCGDVATQECSECFKDEMFAVTGMKQYCNSCCRQAHSHYRRKAHRPTKLHVPEEFQSRSLMDSPRIPRERMELFAVLCIETSHYVSFVKYGPEKENWLFFDSMADRHGDENGFNIPIVTLCPEVAKYLQLPVAALAMEQSRDMEGVAKRLFCDAYMYMYQSKKMALYK
ncbi:ubiquitin carboxyl-terminal hydrolase CYLD-like [Trachemys scripta elegans]|uniref:ubiquitin carboxyl-terminal hydrolase CYLD-like n=1 Tax=Trachemys scripta elegans TaxID=31138 RepID=UPI001552CB6A|nr:ubiquitin carboxyl-terminal hydrolase CYLD-like [Trachemys scripta elegans]